METLPLVFSSGWSSGVNAYATVLVMGLLGRFAGVDAVPPGLQSTEVLLAAALLFAMEFVADKIPYVDSSWDVVSTAIRPTAGAVIGILIAGNAYTLSQAVAGVVGGGTALLSHTVKAGSRLAINSSPEPITNVTASVVEDFAVLGVVWFAIENPRAAAAIAGVLLAGGLVLLYFLARLVRRGWRRWKHREPLPRETARDHPPR